MTLNIFIIIILMSLSSITYSKNIANQSKTFSSFLSCASFLKSQQLKKYDDCFEQSVDMDIDKSYQYILTEFLFLNYKVSEIEDCDKDTKELMSLAKMGDDFICFKITHENQSNKGIVFFTQKNKRLVINKLKYESPE